MTRKPKDTAGIKVTARGAVANKTRRKIILHWTQPTIHPLCSYYDARQKRSPFRLIPSEPFKDKKPERLTDRAFANPPLPYYCHSIKTMQTRKHKKVEIGSQDLSPSRLNKPKSKRKQRMAKRY